MRATKHFTVTGGVNVYAKYASGDAVRTKAVQHPWYAGLMMTAKPRDV